MGHSRMHVAFLLILLPAVAGVIVVNASPTCERVVHEYVSVPVRNAVNKTTADAWAKWRVGHPNWKPSPNASRPKYVMTRKETEHKVDVACEVPVTADTLDTTFSPDELEPPIPVMDMPMETDLIEPDEAPPVVADIPPTTDVAGNSPGGSPFFPPLGGPSGGPSGGVPPGGGSAPPGGGSTPPGGGTTPPGGGTTPPGGGTTPPGGGTIPPGGGTTSTPPDTPPVTAVPEPSSILLVAMGMGSMWASRRKITGKN